jgi:hypothetical protein
MESHWYFYPKYGYDIIQKVVSCFVNEYLSWEDNGYYWNLSKMPNHNGWFRLSASPDGNTDYFTETCFDDEPISGKQLTEDMLILLTGENGCAQENCDPDVSDNVDWTLEETCLDEVLMCLSAEGTHVYAPCGNKLWMCSVDTGNSKMADMFDFILTQKVA